MVVWSQLCLSDVPTSPTFLLVAFAAVYFLYQWVYRRERLPGSFNDYYIRTIRIEKTAGGRLKTIEARAKIDTGSDISLASKPLLTRLSLELQQLSLNQDPKVSQIDGTSVRLAGKIELLWRGENSQYSRSGIRFLPLTRPSTFYIPETSKAPFDVLIGADIINKYGLDKRYCFASGYNDSTQQYQVQRIGIYETVRKMTEEEWKDSERQSAEATMTQKRDELVLQLRDMTANHPHRLELQKDIRAARRAICQMGNVKFEGKDQDEGDALLTDEEREKEEEEKKKKK
ncbi:hypothetical protein EJ08DRAFT_691572 [Tothia fuscella]|uniref:Peptidase A2 domain-containing protein n=1 Tax=Tothia fuscella TaxID=1048955 RepID=A0A9P4U490_9PEZI|nr:hypothetical protein EJ08DRAFT_691572 [Tothia fuscella]